MNTFPFQQKSKEIPDMTSKIALILLCGILQQPNLGKLNLYKIFPVSIETPRIEEY